MGGTTPGRASTAPAPSTSAATGARMKFMGQQWSGAVELGGIRIADSIFAPYKERFRDDGSGTAGPTQTSDSSDEMKSRRRILRITVLS